MNISPPCASRRQFLTATGTIILLAYPQTGHARTPLVTVAEAQLPPPSSNDLSRRAVTRGPTIRSLSPDTDTTPLKANEPFRFNVEFAPRGGSRIDQSSIRVTYLRAHSINITDRLRPFINANGITIQDAVLPPGDHTLRVEVLDDQGRSGSTSLSIRVR